jgi:endonuclease YncB( thermonuclease family)
MCTKWICCAKTNVYIPVEAGTYQKATDTNNATVGNSKPSVVVPERHERETDDLGWFSDHGSDTPRFSLETRHNLHRRTARLVNVHDGHTISVVIKIYGERGAFKPIKMSIRLNGIKAPEMNGNSVQDSIDAICTRNRLIYILTDKCVDLNGKKISRAGIVSMICEKTHLVYLKFFGMDKYGRILADVYTMDNKKNKSVDDRNYIVSDVDIDVTDTDLSNNADVNKEKENEKEELSVNEMLVNEGLAEVYDDRERRKLIHVNSSRQRHESLQEIIEDEMSIPSRRASAVSLLGSRNALRVYANQKSWHG